MTNFTNNFELNKAHHDSFFKKALENDIEKASKGEGSRGGTVIGHTKSGKPIYGEKHASSYEDFTAEDHLDAERAHKAKIKEHQGSRSHKNSSYANKKINDQIDLHEKKSKGHGVIADKKITEEEDKAKNKEPSSEDHKAMALKYKEEADKYTTMSHEAAGTGDKVKASAAMQRAKEATENHEKALKMQSDSLKKSEDTDSLQKAFEVLGLPDAYDRIEKGGKPALVGEIRDFGGRKMIKTKMGPNSWRPYSPGGKHEHLTDSKKEPSKEETKTEPKVESKQEVENKQPTKEKEVEGKEKHGYENYDHMKQVDHVVAHYKLREDEMKKQGIKYASDYSKDSRDYVGDEKANKLKERIQKELPALEHHKTSSKQILGTENITIVDPKIDSSVYSSSYGESGNKIAYNSEKKQADIISRRVKEAYDFATQPHVKKEIKKIDNFCKREGLKASIDYHNIHSPNGKSGTMKMRFWAPSSNDDRNFSIDVAFDRAGNIEFHELGHSIEMSALDRYDNMDSKSLANLKTLKKFSLEFNPDHKDDSGKIDEKWIDLKSKFENYYSGRDGYSQVTKVDDNTIHFTAGDVGKKKQTHDTVRDAARLSPPSSIGGYKLVASDKVADHKGNLVDKKDIINNMLKRDNEYSEYENNVDFTYVYKKK